jgi:hypothetical protein
VRQVFPLCRCATCVILGRKRVGDQVPLTAHYQLGDVGLHFCPSTTNDKRTEVQSAIIATAASSGDSISRREGGRKDTNLSFVQTERDSEQKTPSPAPHTLSDHSRCVVVHPRLEEARQVLSLAWAGRATTAPKAAPVQLLPPRTHQSLGVVNEHHLSAHACRSVVCPCA